MGYAQGTSVPIFKSQEDIKRVLQKYGATSMVMGDTVDKSMVMFEMHSRRVKFVLPLAMEGKAKDKKNILMSKGKVDGENRRRWRCLLLAIKSKLETVESGISAFEDEFLAQIMLPDGQTVGQAMSPQISQSYSTGQMPPLLGYGGHS